MLLCHPVKTLIHVSAPGTSRARVLNNVSAPGASHSRLLTNVSATTTKSTTSTITAGRMQAEKHRSALPCKLRSTAPRCPQVPFRRQALSQDTASRSTSHDRVATGAADSNGAARQLDSPTISKCVKSRAPVYRAWRGNSFANWPLL